jgi:predicted nucleic acid-binding Zn ribbon protein
MLAVLFCRWEQLVGPEIAAHVRPQSVRAGVLTLAADEPAWAAQLRYMVEDLLARIHGEANAHQITEIRIGVRAAQSEGRRRRGS